jgi:hypothetical protein
MFGLVRVFYVVLYRAEATQLVVDASGGGMTLPLFQSLLPSPLPLVPAFVVFRVLTLFSLTSSGFDHDLGRQYR